MPCQTLPMRDPANPSVPIFATVCGPRARRRRCVGYRRLVDRLCDVFIAGPARGGARPTCSAPVGPCCSVQLGPDIDVCPAHPIPDEALAAAGRRR
jgi:hypothetical protein